MAGQGRLTIGDHFEGHRIVAVLGSGGMATVYEAVEEFTERPVALKVMKTQLDGDEQALKRARGEVVTLCKLDHPNVVRVYRADVLPSGCVWMTMPMLSGCPLRNYAHGRGPMPIDEALEICAQIADGVAAAHEIGVIHRDIKPENVMITAQRHVVVIDFNAAKFFELGLKSTIPGKAPGTPQYMAPEQFRPKYTPSPAGDIYQLGVILYELLAGRHPLRELHGELPLTLDIITVGHLMWEFRPLPEVIACPDYVWQPIKQSLEKDPAARHAKIQDYAQLMRGGRRRYLAERGEAGVVARPISTAPGVTSQPGGRREHWAPFELPEHATGGPAPEHEPAFRHDAAADDAPGDSVDGGGEFDEDLEAAELDDDFERDEDGDVAEDERRVRQIERAVRFIAKNDSDEARAGLVRALDHPEPRVREAAALGLQRNGNAGCVPALEHALEDEEDTGVRERIEETLFRLQRLVTTAPSGSHVGSAAALPAPAVSMATTDRVARPRAARAAPTPSPMTLPARAARAARSTRSTKWRYHASWWPWIRLPLIAAAVTVPPTILVTVVVMSILRTQAQPAPSAVVSERPPQATASTRPTTSPSATAAPTSSGAGARVPASSSAIPPAPSGRPSRPVSAPPPSARPTSSKARPSIWAGKAIF